MSGLPSGTVTFLFTDIEGSTRLLQELGDAYAAALAEHRRVLREAFVGHGGVEVDTQGDAFFVAFARATDAVAAAAEAQAALDGPIRVRMGLHTGEPLVTAEGYVGMDVHRAARIAAAGHGGQVVLSRSTRDLAGEVDVRDLGKHRLKDLSAPERLFQLGQNEFAPLRTLYQTNLPVPATPFLGRERELAEVAALLETARLVTVTGEGGSGKTRLALQAAGAAADDFPNGVWWVALAPVTEPADVLPAASRALGTSAPLDEVVGDKRLLLLLDNFEHVIGAAADVGRLLERCPNLRVLVTSRERLRIAAEQVYPAPVLGRADALQLFVSRARAARPDFEPDAHVAELCARLDDLPLALELAAARVTLLSTDELLARLGSRLDLLRGGRDAEVRQETLRATIAWSYELLSEEQQRLLAALSCFRGGWTLAAAEDVCDADIEELQSLVDKSLVRRWESGRFGMLETTREFAVERAAEVVDRAALVRRLAEHVLGLAGSANLHPEASGNRRPELVEPERGNVEVALEWALDSGEVDLGLRLMRALEMFWVTTDPVGCRRWLDALDRADADVEPELAAVSLRMRGATYDMTGRSDLAEQYYEQAGAAFGALGDQGALRNVRFRIASAALHQGDVDRAERLVGEMTSSDGAGAWVVDRPVALTLLGSIALARGRREDGIRLAHEAADLAGSIGWTWWRGVTLLGLAEELAATGDADEAERALLPALAAIRSSGDRVNPAFVVGVGVRIAVERDDPERAGILWGALEAGAERELMPSWSQARQECADAVGQADGPRFEVARGQGRLLAPEQALDLIAGDGAAGTRREALPRSVD